MATFNPVPYRTGIAKFRNEQVRFASLADIIEAFVHFHFDIDDITKVVHPENVQLHTGGSVQLQNDHLPNVQLQNVQVTWYQASNLQNVQVTERPVYKMSRYVRMVGLGSA
jgi:hypothetical protein